MVRTKEQRRAQRYEAKFPIRVIAIDGQPADWVGETRDIGSGGVRFALPNELPVERAIEYIVTLSCDPPVARIVCKGDILRCATSDEPGTGDCFEIAATMRSYSLVGQAETITAVALQHGHLAESFDRSGAENPITTGI